jgi:hypothetical protein
MLELLVFLAEPKVRVGGHDPVVLAKVLELDRARGLDDGVGQADGVALLPAEGPAHVPGMDVLAAVAAVKFPERHEGDEDEDEQDDGNSDPNLQAV